MTELKIDVSKLLGFRLGATNPATGEKSVTFLVAGAKIGDKAGGAVGAKIVVPSAY